MLSDGGGYMSFGYAMNTLAAAKFVASLDHADSVNCPLPGRAVPANNDDFGMMFRCLKSLGVDDDDLHDAGVRRDHGCNSAKEQMVLNLKLPQGAVCRRGIAVYYITQPAWVWRIDAAIYHAGK